MDDNGGFGALVSSTAWSALYTDSVHFRRLAVICTGSPEEDYAYSCGCTIYTTPLTAASRFPDPNRDVIFPILSRTLLRPEGRLTEDPGSHWKRIHSTG